MKEEINSAVKFLTQFLSQTELSPDQIAVFRDNLSFLITERFQNHWHPSSPLKGNAYRCLNVDSTTVDPLIMKASYTSGISPSKFQALFSDGLALWIDPRDVCYRLGKRPVITTIYGHTDEVSFASNPYNCSPRGNYNTYNLQHLQHKSQKYPTWNSQFSYMQATEVF